MGVVASMRAHWDELWDQLRVAAIKDGDGQPLLDACSSWRRVYWAAAGMKKFFPSSDEVWTQLTSGQLLVDRFMQRLYTALSNKLSGYTSQLLAIEEVSRCTSLSTVVKIAVHIGGVRKTRDDVRLVQTTIQETGGWGKCSSELLQNIGEHGALAMELLLDHIRNLLDLCERSVAEFNASADADRGPALPPAGHLASRGPRPGPAALTEAGAAMMDCDGEVACLARRGKGQPESTRALILQLYAELCDLLAPRVEEVQGLWRGLRTRGWGAERVETLNTNLSKDLVPCLDAPDLAMGLA